MSDFINRITKELKYQTGCDFVHSFNEEVKELYKKNEINYLIVGTLTPPDGRTLSNQNEYSGFFYCSENNKQFELIDENLAAIKRNFRRGEANKKDIIQILLNKRIALLDVVKEAYVKPGSSSDNDIKSFSLDIDSFETFDYSKIKKIIPNSLNAYFALKEISNHCQKLALMFKEGKVQLIPQQVRGYTKKSEDPLKMDIKPYFISDAEGKSTEKLKQAWKDALK